MPVDVASGNLFTAWHDIEIDGVHPLVWRRFYSTRFLDRDPSILGRGWIHSFDMSLVRDLEGYRYSGHDGDTIVFDDEEYAVESRGSIILNRGECMELRREGEWLVVYHWHDWQEDVGKFYFPRLPHGAAKLARVALPSGFDIVLDYSHDGRLRQIRQTVERRSLLLNYTGGGLLDSIELAAPSVRQLAVARYEYDPGGRLVAVYDANGAPMRYAYDTDGRMSEETSRTGGTVRMKYDSRGRCVEIGGENRYQLRSFQYDEAANATRVTDSLGNLTLYQLNELGQVTQEQLPNGGLHTTAFDEFGRVVSKTGPMGETTEQTFGDGGEISAITYPNGSITKFEYTSEHQPVRITQGNGSVWQLDYERGALVGVTDPEGAETRYLRDAGNVLTEIDTPAGNHIRIAHDAEWSEEVMTDDLGLIYRQDLDIRLQPVAIYDARGLIRRVEYDSNGEVTAIVEADNSTRRYTHDAGGQIARYTDANGGSFLLEYTPYCDHRRITDANGYTYSYTQDTEGRLVSVTNPKGEVSLFVYDAMGAIVRWMSFDGRTEAFDYDLSSRRIRWRKSSGAVLDYSYDAAGNLERLESAGAPLVSNTYDPAGNLVKTVTPAAEVELAYDLCGRVLRETQNGRTVRYRYHPSGELASRSLEGSYAGEIGLSYDVRNRLIRLAAGNRPFQTLQYDAANLKLSRHLGPAVERFEYDVRRRPTRVRIGRFQDDIVSRNYSYDAEDNLTKVVDSRRGATAYEYDIGERLIRVSDSTRGEVAFEYDPCNNLVRRDGTVLDYGAGNRLTRFGGATVEHGPDGSVVRIVEQDREMRLLWDALGQLAAIDSNGHGITRYGYDGFGRRTFKQQGEEVTQYFWSRDDLLAQGAGESFVEYAIGDAVPDAIWENGEIRHVVLSYAGAPYELLDERGRLVWWGEYDPWGALVAEVRDGASHALRLPGQYFDPESGLHYNRFRYYHALSGTFVSPDPLGLAGGMNEFLYAINPLNWSDPLGLKCGKKNHRYSVYVLTQGNPPQIVYVGITKRSPASRLQEHSKFKKGQFDKMYVVDSGLTRVQARNIEGSALHNIGSSSGVTGIPKASMLNERRNDKQFYHSYGDPPARGRTLYDAPTTQSQLDLTGKTPV